MNDKPKTWNIPVRTAEHESLSEARAFALERERDEALAELDNLRKIGGDDGAR
jgi:hypothetical protein